MKINLKQYDPSASKIQLIKFQSALKKKQFAHLQETNILCLKWIRKN